MPGIGPCDTPSGFLKDDLLDWKLIRESFVYLDGRDFKYSPIPSFSGSAIVRVVILPSPIPSTTDLAQESTASCMKLCQTFHLLSSPSLSGQPGYKGKEQRIGG